MQYRNLNFHPEQEVEQDPMRCPTCAGALEKHLVCEQPGFRVYSYHCRDHGDVVPVEKHA